MRNSVDHIEIHYRCDGCGDLGIRTLPMEPEFEHAPGIYLGFVGIPDDWVRMVGEDSYAYCSRDCAIKGMNSDIVMDQVSDVLPYDEDKDAGHFGGGNFPGGFYEYP